MTKEKLREKFSKILIFQEKGKRAPHKPLILLFFLSHYLKTKENSISFKELEKPVKDLLEGFGPYRKSYGANYPFWRLQKDGFWQVQAEGKIQLSSSGDASVSDLRQYAKAGFTEDVYKILEEDKSFIYQLIQDLLDNHFSSSLHEDILDQLGIDLNDKKDMEVTSRLKRDPYFRNRVLIAYNYSCAVCGFDIKISGQSTALEAAHIKSHRALSSHEESGESNGLALCSVHHKLFDYGAYTVRGAQIFISEKAHGGESFERWLKAFHQKPLRSPTHEKFKPQTQYEKWHQLEIFKGEF